MAHLGRLYGVPAPGCGRGTKSSVGAPGRAIRPGDHAAFASGAQVTFIAAARAAREAKWQPAGRDGVRDASTDQLMHPLVVAPEIGIDKVLCLQFLAEALVRDAFVPPAGTPRCRRPRWSCARSVAAGIARPIH